MSPANDNKMSSVGVLAVTIVSFMVLAAGCFPTQKPFGPESLSDRLLNLLIQQKLPLDEPGTPVQGEVERCGEWLREQLVKNPAESFRFEPYDNRLVAESSGLARRLVPELSYLLNQLNTFFHFNSAVPQEYFTSDFIKGRILHPLSRDRIIELIEIDKRESISEIGGVVIADPEKDYMEFHIIESDNARWVRSLRQNTDPEMFSVTLRKILPKLPFVRLRAQRTLDILQSTDTDNDNKQLAIDSFMELLSYYSRYSYILDQGSQYAAIAKLGISGVYMGIFHIHPEDNLPSMDDKIGSILRKNFVFVPTTDAIEVHYLDFSGDLRDTSLVIHFPVNGL
jgi:hypothetical protein